MAALTTANGRRRERILGADEVAQVVREALVDGIGYTAGGNVAHAYDYNATKTVATAVAVGDLVAIGVTTASAHNGSPVTWIGCASTHPTSIIKYLTKIDMLCTDEAITAALAWADLTITRRQAKTWIRSLAQQAAAATAALTAIQREPSAAWGTSCHPPNVRVTLAHSLAAGNCGTVSRRVAKWFPGRSAVPAAELLAEINRREPTLRSFAVRAIARAV
jgi:hypothetical protein